MAQYRSRSFFSIISHGSKFPREGKRGPACKGFCDSGSREVQEIYNIFFNFQLLGSFIQESRISEFKYLLQSAMALHSKDRTEKIGRLDLEVLLSVPELRIVETTKERDDNLLDTSV